MTRTQSPSTTAGYGRGERGQFAPGNKFAKGNPHAVRVGKLRAIALEAVTFADMRAIVKKLVELAKAGDIAAAREILSRCLGAPEAIDVLERLEALESMLTDRGGTTR